MQKTQKPSNHEPPLNSLPYVNVFPALGSLKLDTPLQSLSHKCQIEGNNHHFSPASGYPPAQPTMQLPFFARRTHLSTTQCPQGPLVLFYKAASQPASAALCCCMGLFHPGCISGDYCQSISLA